MLVGVAQDRFRASAVVQRLQAGDGGLDEASQLQFKCIQV